MPEFRKATTAGAVEQIAFVSELRGRRRGQWAFLILDGSGELAQGFCFIFILLSIVVLSAHNWT